MQNKKERIKKELNTKRFLRETGLFLVDIFYNAVVIIALVILIRSFLISPFRVIGSSMADTLQSNEFILIDKLSYRLGEPQRGDPVVFRPPITSKYSYKFQGVIKTDDRGEAVFDIRSLKTVNPVIYCQNKITAAFWFCEDKADVGDMVFLIPIANESDLPNDFDWRNSKEQWATEEEVQNQQLRLSGKSNQFYAIRIYDSTGPEYFVKRIIGIPGDKIKIENGRVYLKPPDTDSFKALEEPYLNSENKDHTYFNQSIASNTFEVPDEHYFVLGDNRNHSNDSRSWFLPVKQEVTPYVSSKNISGKVLIVLWPLNDLRIIPGTGL